MRSLRRIPWLAALALGACSFDLTRHPIAEARFEQRPIGDLGDVRQDARPDSPVDHRAVLDLAADRGAEDLPRLEKRPADTSPDLTPSIQWLASTQANPCPSGTNLLAGGFLCTGSWAVMSQPVGQSWDAACYAAAVTNIYQACVGAGFPAISHYPGTASTSPIMATCQTGIVAGGGCKCNSGALLSFLAASNGWNCYCEAGGGTATAICLQVASGTILSLSGSTAKVSTASCASGQKLVGGACSTSQPGDQVVASAPSAGLKGWTCTFVTAGTAHAYCMTP